MKINDNPSYNKILKNIKYDERSRDLIEAINIIDNMQTLTGSKVIDSYFHINQINNLFDIKYMVNLDGLIFKGFVLVKKNGEVLQYGKNIKDNIEDLPF